jgi:hypothetical protein
MIDINMNQRIRSVSQLFISASNNDYLAKIPASVETNAPTK